MFVSVASNVSKPIFPSSSPSTVEFPMWIAWLILVVIVSLFGLHFFFDKKEKQEKMRMRRKRNGQS